jgi:tetratricopeptide (TPR) repeat protein
MAKSPCVSCGNNKGRRICVRLERKIICPECCVAKRNENCLPCEHYLAAKRLDLERFCSTGKHTFIVNITFEDEINEILQRLEQTFDKKRAARELEKYADETSPYYCFARGVLCMMREEVDEAVSFFEKSVLLFPYFVPGWCNLASAQMKSAHTPEAYDACQVALKLSSPKGYYHQLAQKQLQEMQEFIEKHTPFGFQEHIQRARDFVRYYDLMRKAPQKAAAGFLKLLEKEPNHVQCHGNLGICYSLLGRKADAERELKKALELDPAYHVARTNLLAINAMQEGVPLAKNSQVSYFEMEFYRTKHTLKKSGNLAKKQAIRELFTLCGIPIDS